MDRYLKYNVSCYFWLKPITNINLQEHVKSGFVNSFLEFEDNKGLFLEYNINDSYYILLKEMTKNVNFQDEYNVGDTSIVYFKIGEEWNNDYDLFLKGNYSKMSSKFKNSFSRNIKDRQGNIVTSLQWKIFEKDILLKKELEDYIKQPLPKDVDYFFLPNLEKEKWKINV